MEEKQVKTFPARLATFRLMVKTRGDSLRALQREELLAAARAPVETWDVRGRRAVVGIIVQTREDGSLRVVVQGFMPSRWIPGLSSVALDGFYRRPDGSTEPMPDEEFYEFD